MINIGVGDRIIIDGKHQATVSELHQKNNEEWIITYVGCFVEGDKDFKLIN